MMKSSVDRATGRVRQRHVAILGLLGVGMAAAAVIGAMKASATPPAGIVAGPIVARGPVTQDVVIGVPQTLKVARRVQVRVGNKVVRKRVTFEVASVRRLMSCSATAPCDLAFQQLTIAPGGHTGWHTHPGPTLVSVAQGEGTLYHSMAGCPAHKYGTGTSFFQPSTEVHNFRNEGSAPLVVYAVYYLPAGTPNTGIRIDQPQPAGCTNVP
jgi:quercetin dioxygenase-like cupin family protein